MFILNLKSSTWVKINCALTSFVAILSMLMIIDKTKINHVAQDISSHDVNPCCGFPCQNGGVCFPTEKTFVCDCSDTGYFGKNCEKPTLGQLLKNMFGYQSTAITSGVTTSFPMMWRMINYFSLFRRMLNKNIYSLITDLGCVNFKWKSSFDFNLIDFYNNFLLCARSLPPTPKMCPTPMGFYGPKKLPDPNEVFERLFQRKSFQECPKGTNLLFATYLQHFVSQFDNHDKHDYWKTPMIDMSQIYGKKESIANCLRSFRGGKLKTKNYYKEDYPPFFNDCPQAPMIYPKKPFELISILLRSTVQRKKWALGNPHLNMTPMLFVFSTIWIREHNRVCKVLAIKHPQWRDEELYQTARLIITGEAIKITLTEIMKHITQSNIDLLYRPEFTTDLNMDYLGNVPKELSLMPMWHCMIPDRIRVGPTLYNSTDLLYSDNNIVFKNGIDNMIHAMSTTPAGETTFRNIGVDYKIPTIELIKQSRALKMQSYNNYRKRFGLNSKKTFEELTGDLHLAAILKELYVDVDGVELIVGLLTEQKGSGFASPSMIAMTGSWLIRGLLSHPINSPEWWKPATFGGNVGINIVKQATLKKLICLNLKTRCHNVHVDIKLPRRDDIN
ncbi:hypothetical protein FQR65_LT09722 [Abscondita terminalis]|nr:hypothetical protein FQR65_LT09722 [Abscondita terminalis]